MKFVVVQAHAENQDTPATLLNLRSQHFYVTCHSILATYLSLHSKFSGYQNFNHVFCKHNNLSIKHMNVQTRV